MSSKDYLLPVCAYPYMVLDILVSDDALPGLKEKYVEAVEKHNDSFIKNDLMMDAGFDVFVPPSTAPCSMKAGTMTKIPFDIKCKAYMLEKDTRAKVGFIVLDDVGSIHAIVQNNTRSTLHSFSVNLSKNMPNYAENRRAYIAKISDLSLKLFRDDICSIVLVGDAEMATELVDILESKLAAKVTMLFDTQDSMEIGLNNALNTTEDKIVQYIKFPVGFYMYPRSSLSKTTLRLANSVGIIDAGYRGKLIGAFDCHKKSCVVEPYEKLVQICAPSLCPIYARLVDSLGDATERGEDGFGSTS